MSPEPQQPNSFAQWLKDTGLSAPEAPPRDFVASFVTGEYLTFQSHNSTYAILEYLGGLVGTAPLC
jgi:hypothetical protein